MTKEQERVLAQIEANDPHPEQGEIKFATDRVTDNYLSESRSKMVVKMDYTNAGTSVDDWRIGVCLRTVTCVIHSLR